MSEVNQSCRPNSIFLIPLHLLKNYLRIKSSMALYLPFASCVQYTFIHSKLCHNDNQNFIFEVLLFHTIKPYSIRSLTLYLVFFPQKTLFVRKSQNKLLNYNWNQGKTMKLYEDFKSTYDITFTPCKNSKNHYMHTLLSINNKYQMNILMH